LKCYNFLWAQQWHNCPPAASFANCVMALYLLKVHLQTFLFIPITQKCQILSCDTLVTNERYVYFSSIVEPTRCTISQIYFILEQYSTCFGRSFHSSEEGENCTYSIRYISYRFCGCLLASTQRTCMTDTWCCMYSLLLLMIDGKTSETCRMLFQNKLNLRYCASGWFYYRNILWCTVLQMSNMYLRLTCCWFYCNAMSAYLYIAVVKQWDQLLMSFMEYILCVYTQNKYNLFFKVKWHWQTEMWWGRRGNMETLLFMLENVIHICVSSALHSNLSSKQNIVN